MFKRKLSLAAVPLVIAGCWTGPANQAGTWLPNVNNVSGLGLVQEIDLSGGMPAPAGYGKLRVTVPIPRAQGRSIQALQDQQLIMVVTGPGGTKITDAAGKAAVYRAKVASSGVATITLGALPNTTNQTSGGPSANAYVVTAMVGNWTSGTPLLGGADLDAKGTGSATGYTDIETDSGAAAGAYNGYGHDDAGKLAFDLDKDVVTSSADANRLLASGATRADVSPGLTTTVSITTTTHTALKFAGGLGGGASFNPTGGPATSAALSNIKRNTLKTDASGSIAFRFPGLSKDMIDTTEAAGFAGKRVVRFAVRMDDATFGAGAAPAVAIREYDTAAGTESTTVAVVANSGALSTSVSQGSNAGFTNSGLSSKYAWADVDLSGLGGADAAKHVVDFSFTGLPGGASASIYMVPLGTEHIPSSADVFETIIK